jgi:hypothetical protein
MSEEQTEKTRQSTSPPPSKKVKWGVEEPSEYRPETAIGTIGNLGKDKESFRVFYDVSTYAHITVQLYSVFVRAHYPYSNSTTIGHASYVNLRY